MKNQDIRVLLEDSRFEIFDAMVIPLRAISPLFGEMTHAQELTDIATLCDSLLNVIGGGDQAVVGKQNFFDYLGRRRKIQFSENELHAIIPVLRQTILQQIPEQFPEQEKAAIREKIIAVLQVMDEMISDTEQTSILAQGETHE